jgi:hypothetical protein
LRPELAPYAAAIGCVVAVVGFLVLIVATFTFVPFHDFSYYYPRYLIEQAREPIWFSMAKVVAVAGVGASQRVSA